MKPKARCCYCQNVVERFDTKYWCENCQQFLEEIEVEVSDDEVDTVSFYRKHKKENNYGEE